MLKYLLLFLYRVRIIRLNQYSKKIWYLKHLNLDIYTNKFNDIKVRCITNDIFHSLEIIRYINNLDLHKDKVDLNLVNDYSYKVKDIQSWYSKDGYFIENDIFKKWLEESYTLCKTLEGKLSYKINSGNIIRIRPYYFECQDIVNGLLDKI